MELSIYPIHSDLQGSEVYANRDTRKLLKELEERLDLKFKVIGKEELSKARNLLILVQSGGSEGYFLKDIYPGYQGPYYLLTYGSSNSLASSLEILSFIKEQGKKGEILHGNTDYIVERIKAVFAEERKETKPVRLGVLGHPSDWLIASDVDYQEAKRIFNIALVDVKEEEIIKAIKAHQETEHPIFQSRFDEGEVEKAYQIYLGVKDILKNYKLDGFTLRCFDIIKATKMSACLALALYNREDVIASCEGDVPSMLTAYLILKRLHLHAFQANPQSIDPLSNVIELAHCTLPLDMASSYQFTTHFESGIGLGIHGEMKEGACTIVKLSSDLREFYCEEGSIVANEERNDRCRTQIRIRLNAPADYFLRSSLGNHHQVIYGHHQRELRDYLLSFGLRQVR